MPSWLSPALQHHASGLLPEVSLQPWTAEASLQSLHGNCSLELEPASCVGFLVQVEACFDQLNPEAALQELLQRCVGKLNDLCDMVGRSLSNLERKVMIALITIEVHNR